MSFPKIQQNIFGNSGAGPEVNQSALPIASESQSGVLNTSVQSISGIKTFTSSPVVPTLESSDNSTKVASTAFVNAVISSKGVSSTGSRGTLAGYETTGTATTINNSSTDSNVVSSNVTVENGTVNTAWTKIALLTSVVSVTLGSNWVWAGGEAPTIVANSILVCTWCGSKGIATLLSPSS